jgi:hypothetical protein
MQASRRLIAARHVALLLTGLLLSACANMGDSSRPIPQALITGAGGADRPTLVIVLPGRQDNVEVMQKFRVAQAIQAGWPEVDVQLTSATLAYYRDGGLARRVHQQLIAPARAAGYQRVILMGASMGGMGTLIVDQAHPGTIDQLVLLAPYLGERDLLQSIGDAGGIEKWQPGPKPATVNSDNFQTELWRHIQNFSVNEISRRRVWLAYGEEDRLAQTMPLLEAALDPAQILQRPGGHRWTVWNAAATEIFAALREQATASPTPGAAASLP